MVLRGAPRVTPSPTDQTGQPATETTMRSLSVLCVGVLLAGAIGAAPPLDGAVARGAGPAFGPDGVAAPVANSVAPGFWSAARMGSARSRDVLVRQVPGDVAKVPAAKGGKGGGNGGGKPPKGDGSVTGTDWTGGGAVQATTGKVYFTLGASNYVCSGSSVDSPSGDLVLTAGHCVYDQAVGYASNFTFVPDHDADGASFGQWPATQLITTTGWQAGDFEEDAAFAIIGEQSGQSLSQVVGGQGIDFDLARNQQTSSFGYPAGRPYRGNDLTYCAGVAVNDPYGSGVQGLRCNMTGGSSGGPWLQSFDDATGAGVLSSVNSFKYSNDSSTMYGPYFDASIRSLFEAAEALAG